MSFGRPFTLIVPRDRRVGFTLAEAVVGIGLATVVILMILLLAASALRGDQKVEVRNVAATLAESQLDLLARSVASLANPARQAFWQAPDGAYSGSGVTTSLTTNGTDFSLKYTISTITAPDGTPLGSEIPGNRLRQVDLSVAWWEGEAGRTGYGRLSIHRTRILRESDVKS